MRLGINHLHKGCSGRQRNITPSRGDVDDALGNFSLTLVDSLDTLAVVGEYDEFERALGLIVENVKFDSDLVVSVFETNIRMIGGLISGCLFCCLFSNQFLICLGHIMSLLIKQKYSNRLGWYSGQLLEMATNLADRLLVAFNSTSGVPYSRVIFGNVVC